MDQLAERSLPTLEVCSSNPRSSSDLSDINSANCIEKKKSKKRGG